LKKGGALIEFTLVLVLKMVLIRLSRTLLISRIFFAYLMRQNAVVSCFANFSKILNSKKLGVTFYESSSLKVYYEQSFRISDFSNLSSHSRYSYSVKFRSEVDDLKSRIIKHLLYKLGLKTQVWPQTKKSPFKTPWLNYFGQPCTWPYLCYHSLQCKFDLIQGANKVVVVVVFVKKSDTCETWKKLLNFLNILWDIYP